MAGITRVTGGSGELYLFIIDTNAYAGNFERQIGGFCTGCIGDCEVGEDEERSFIDTCGQEQQEAFEEIISREPDEHGCSRPVDILGYGEDNNSVVIYFREQPSEEQIALMKERAYEFAKYHDTNGGPLRSNKSKKLEVRSFRLHKEMTETKTEILDIKEKRRAT